MQLTISMERAQGTKKMVWKLPPKVTPEPSSIDRNRVTIPTSIATRTVTRNANRQVRFMWPLRKRVTQPPRLTNPQLLQFREPAKEHPMLLRNGRHRKKVKTTVVGIIT